MVDTIRPWGRAGMPQNFSGTELGKVVAGSTVTEVLLLGCTAGGSTGLARDVANAAPGVRVIAFGSTIRIDGVTRHPGSTEVLSLVLRYFAFSR